MKGRAGTHQGAMSTTSSGHAAVQRAHEPSKEGCRGTLTRADDAGWVVSSRPRAPVLQASGRDDVEQIDYFFIIRFFILLCRQIDEAMTSASIEEKKEEEEAKEEYETEREGARRRCGGE